MVGLQYELISEIVAIDVEEEIWKYDGGRLSVIIWRESDTLPSVRSK